jgi:NAD+ kinase
MAVVVLVVHEDRPEAVAQADVLATALVADGHRVDRSDNPDFVSSGVDDATDLVVSLGGDGSILRAINLLDGRTAPVLGVNHGELGYLTTVEPVEAHAAVSRVLAGHYDLEERMMLRVEMYRSNEGTSEMVGYALNEVVVERGAGSQTVRVAVSLDGEPFTSYAADGLIAATPTGSTAYAFSARGPIVDPLHRAIQLTPVSPHMLFDRTLVLDPSTEVGMEVLGRRAATCTVDGRSVANLKGGDRVVCTAAERVAHLVTFTPRDLRGLLVNRFGLADR